MAAEEVASDGVHYESFVGHALRACVVFVVLRVRFCVCDCGPSVVMFLNVITRERQVLSSNRCVVSGRARKCRDGTREGAASRVRAAVRKLSYVTRVGSARVCRSDGVLQVGVSCSPCVAAAVMQQQRSLTSNATQIK